MIWPEMTKNWERIEKGQAGPSLKCPFLTKPYSTNEFMVVQNVETSSSWVRTKYTKHIHGQRATAQQLNTIIDPAVQFVQFAL